MEAVRRALSGVGPTDLTPGMLPVEQALLGAILASPGRDIPPLAADEFTLERSRLVWGAILAVAERGDRPDLVTVAHELAAAGDLDLAGGPAFLAACIEEGCIALETPAYARLVRDAALRRRLYHLGSQLMSEGLGADEIERRLQELPGALGGTLFDPAENWRRIVGKWQKAERPMTRIGPLDDLTGGLWEGEPVIVAARTAHGKTAFVCGHLALAFASQGHDTEIVTLEDPPDAIVRRQVANLAGVPTKRLKTGDLSDGEFKAAEDAVTRLQELPLTVTGLDTIRTLDEDAVVAAVARSRAQVVLVDHLQKVQTRGESRNYGLERVMNGLHAAALREQKALVLSVQISREVEGTQGRKPRPPRLSDLRDSGGLEILARGVWLLYWPWQHDSERNAGDFEIRVAKQNDGPTGLVSCRFDAATGRFS